MTSDSNDSCLSQSRRDFCRSLSFAGGATLLSQAGATVWLGGSTIASAQNSNRTNRTTGRADRTALNSLAPHFLLHIVVEQGWSPSYLFDARPRTFTSAGLWENYHDSNGETLAWTDRRGRTGLVSPAMKSLSADFAENPCFSVVRGLHGSTDFDGHFENLRLLLSGSTTGGTYLGVNVNQGSSRSGTLDTTPLDYLSLGQVLFGSGLKGGTNLPLSLPLAQALLSMADETTSPSTVASAALGITRQNYAAAAKSAGLGGEGARQFGTASTQTGSIRSALSRLDLTGLPASPSRRCADDVALALRAFASGLGRTAIVGFPVFSMMVEGVENVNIDSHDGGAAASQPAIYAAISQQLADVFALLRKTPFDAAGSLSFLDVTSVIVTSEFGRTNRQPGKAIDKTGTDHNRFGGMALVGGKGIEPGLFVGSTDLDQLVTKNDGSQDFAPPSLAHDRFDPGHLMAMGHVYDFGAGTSAPNARPETYRQGDYLTTGSLVNSVYSLFGVPEDSWRAQSGLGGSVGDKFKVIQELIKKT